MNFKIKLFLLLFLVSYPAAVLASTTDGIVDPTYKYAWGENIGWINFSCDNCNVSITDSGLSGYALSETVGWIYLDDITNDGNGNLSGNAWSENTGWIKFNPANGGVTINSSGEFSGSALGENIGWIIFGGDYKVKTDWRPQSARPACNNASDDDGDGKTDYSADPGCSSLDDTDEIDPAASSGGGVPSAWYNPPTAPTGGFSVLINPSTSSGQVKTTNSNIVTLTLRGGSDTARMVISNFADFRNAGQETYSSIKEWNLCQGKEACDEGEYIVYVKFYAAWGQSSEVVLDTIVYQKAKPIIEQIKEIPQNIIEEVKKIPEAIAKIPELIKKIPDIFKPKEPEETKPPEVPIEELVPKETPLVFSGQWQLLPQESIREFVLAPLPEAIKNLAQKFPTLEKTFEETGITKITDVSKLSSVKLTLPGLTERVGLPTIKGVPVANLSLSAKQQLPTEIIFAKTGGELIDFNPSLSVSEKGEPQQKISTISGKPLQLAVKPDKPVKSVRGYLVFKSKGSQPTSLELPSDSLLASVIFASPVFAHPFRNESLVFVEGAEAATTYSSQGMVAGVAISNGARPQEQPVRIEEKLVLQEFEYTDPDNDGIYTAQIQAPVVEGEYEIITVMDFEDLTLGAKEIRLITVVDPEGYVYEKNGDKETRIPGAIISLFWLNLETKQYELWPAKEYQQENPQVTNVGGNYSFLVPEGDYYLKAEAPGYPSFEGKAFEVKEGSGIHFNIELKSKYSWLKIVDWKTILLIFVVLLLFYNFYKDKIRGKLIHPVK